MGNTADSSQDEQITQLYLRNHELIEALNNLRQKLKSPTGEPQVNSVKSAEVKEEMTEGKR
jgi:hypothetical protein